MASTRTALASIEEHVLESMGSRAEGRQPPLAPIPHPKDVGRRPLDGFGCLEIDQVIPDPGQPRTDFPAESLTHLANSIRDKGQLAPIRVRWSDELGKWVIIAGERRWRATKLAGLPTIECYFQADELSRAETLEQQLIENLLREDLKPLEEATGFSVADASQRLERQAGRRDASRSPVARKPCPRAAAVARGYWPARRCRRDPRPGRL